MPELSDRLCHLREVIEAQHIRRASDAQMQPEDTFRIVLAMLWEWVVHPVIRSLSLEMNPCASQIVLYLELTSVCRNLMYHQDYGGAPQGYSPFCLYTQLVFMMKRSLSVFQIMLYRRTRQASPLFSATCTLLPARLKWWRSFNMIRLVKVHFPVLQTSYGKSRTIFQTRAWSGWHMQRRLFRIFQ